MERLDVWDIFVVLVAVAGPPKVVLSFAHLGGRYTPAQLRDLAWRASGLATLSGASLALIADPLLAAFHIEHAGVMVAGGAIFFVFALRLVLEGPVPPDAAGGGTGLGPLLIPFVASPLAMTSVIVLAEFGDGWAWSVKVALVYVIVIAIDLVTLQLLTLVLHRLPRSGIEVAGRLLGLLLATVGVELLIDGLALMGVIRTPGKR